MNSKQLKKLLHYDPDTGEFTRRVTRGNSKAGNVVGCKGNHGYLVIRIGDKLHLAHVLAYLYMTGHMPETDLDHINGVRDDNRWSNIRLVNRQDNLRNSKRSVKNTSGVTGVSWSSGVSKWYANIGINYKTKNLGYHTDFFEAVCARKSAEVKHNFHENHGRR